MVTLAEIIVKLKEILIEEKGQKKIFDKDVAQELRIPQATFATMKKRNSIPYREILEFCALRKISVNWLFFDQAVDMLKEETDKYFKIRYFSDVQASAGGGANIDSENCEHMVVDEKILSEIADATSGKLEAIRVIGESMEPTLLDGSLIIIDRDNKVVRAMKMYVVRTPDGLFIKRVEECGDKIKLYSDNPEYASMQYDLAEVDIVGKVEGSINSY